MLHRLWHDANRFHQWHEGSLMTWSPFRRKRGTPPVTLESFKQSPGKVAMDENGYAGLSPEAVNQIERLRQSKGWGVRTDSGPPKRWWQRLFRREGRFTENACAPLKRSTATLSLKRPCPYIPDEEVSRGMSVSILRPLVGSSAIRHNSNQWKAMRGRWDR